MAVHNTSDLHFMKGLLHHALCGFILELECYVSAEHGTTPRPVKLDVSIIEGTVGKLKRVVQDQGSTRIRDACIRAKLCASETHLDILGVVAGPLEKLIAETVEANIESVASKKDRLGKMRLAWCRAKAEKREQRRRVRHSGQSWFLRSRFASTVTTRGLRKSSWSRPRCEA